MAIITINTGSGANSGDGDSIRTAFTKINQNFSNLETSFIGAGVASFNGLGGIVTFSATDIVSLLGYIPYSSTNPQNFLSGAVLDTYATQAYVQNSLTNYLTTASAISFVSTETLASYATLAYVNSTLTNYLTPATLPNELTNYVTNSFLLSLDYQDGNQVANAIAASQAGYLTTASLAPYSTIAYVDASIAAAGNADRIVAKDATGTVVASLIITPSGNIQSEPGRISYQNNNTGLLAFDHETSSTYTKFNGRFPGNSFTATTNDYTIEFDWTTGQLFLPEYKADTERRARDLFNNPRRPGFPLSAGYDLNYQKARIFATNHGYTKDLNTTEYFWDWGKAIVLAVDTQRGFTPPSAYSDVSGFNYLQVSGNGVEINAHSGTVAIVASAPVVSGDALIVNRYFYEFSENGFIFPDATVQNTAYNLNATVPASSTSAGIKGQMAVSGNFLYVCIATNTWRRFTGSTF